MGKINSANIEASGSVLTVRTLGRLDRKTQVASAALAALVLFVYFFYPAYPTVAGKSLAGWTWYACNSVNQFLHGRFVPIAFIVMCYLAVKRARDEVLSPNNLGLVLVVVGLLFFLLSVRAIQPRMALIGAPFTIIGLVHYVGGFKVARHFIFPAFFWWFAIPVPGLKDALTGHLQILITQSCYHTGVFLGMDLVNQGSKISVSGSPLDIAEGCSGIRSLMALAMIAAVYANYTQKVLWKKAVLFVSALPLAIIGNFFRIFTILVLTNFGFEDFAKTAYHDWAGLLLFFPITLTGLYVIDYLLNLKTRRRKKVKRSVKTSRKNSETVTP